jgi:hypothetical protein
MINYTKCNRAQLRSAFGILGINQNGHVEELYPRAFDWDRKHPDDPVSNHMPTKTASYTNQKRLIAERKAQRARGKVTKIMAEKPPSAARQAGSQNTSTKGASRGKKTVKVEDDGTIDQDGANNEDEGMGEPPAASKYATTVKTSAKTGTYGNSRKSKKKARNRKDLGQISDRNGFSEKKEHHTRNLLLPPAACEINVVGTDMVFTNTWRLNTRQRSAKNGTRKEMTDKEILESYYSQPLTEIAPEPQSARTTSFVYVSPPVQETESAERFNSVEGTQSIVAKAHSLLEPAKHERPVRKAVQKTIYPTASTAQKKTAAAKETAVVRTAK